MNDNCNIFVETRTSNYLKSSFHVDDYEAIRDLVVTVRMPVTCVNRDLVFRPCNMALERRLRDAKVGERELDYEDYLDAVHRGTQGEDN